MKIVFKFDPSRIDVVDHIIRNMDGHNEEGEAIRDHAHLQVRCRERSGKFEGQMCLVINYEDRDGKFLGSDSGSELLTKRTINRPIPVSVPITIPIDAEFAECELSLGDPDSGFYTWAWRIGMVMLLLIVASWVIRSYEGLLW